ncbi:MAG: GyrI-like domain-containing protein [Rhodocyclaceae bacterium]|jgi:AraC family transcriptional regulator
MAECRFIDLPTLTVVGLEALCHGSDDVSALWLQFNVRMDEVMPRGTVVAYGLCEPTQGGLRYLAGCEARPGSSSPAGMHRWILPGQRYAVFTHTGPVSELSRTCDRAFATLSSQGIVPADEVIIERYDERFTGPVRPGSQLDVLIPVAERTEV